MENANHVRSGKFTAFLDHEKLTKYRWVSTLTAPIFRNPGPIVNGVVGGAGSFIANISTPDSERQQKDQVTSSFTTLCLGEQLARTPGPNDPPGEEEMTQVILRLGTGSQPRPKPKLRLLLPNHGQDGNNASCLLVRKCLHHRLRRKFNEIEDLQRVSNQC
ncbi:hypothetical protein FVE85_2867 [Porphyridium purpureum]|uniref:Uncharacterized protein n=1 Tax=Porphyridium purpureum TaxID=35688 RepID=A0A5J4YTF0_PORPP|nr:hypothetical protein FVE85_2867 [Porphyridium purpureum]|eukprot:POR1469..scf227_4